MHFSLLAQLSHSLWPAKKQGAAKGALHTSKPVQQKHRQGHASKVPPPGPTRSWQYLGCASLAGRRGASAPMGGVSFDTNIAALEPAGE